MAIAAVMMIVITAVTETGIMTAMTAERIDAIRGAMAAAVLTVTAIMIMTAIAIVPCRFP